MTFPNNDFSVFRNIKTLMSYQAGYMFGMKYFMGIAVSKIETLLPTVLLDIHISPTRYDTEGYLVGVVEASIVCRCLKNGNQLPLREELTSERVKLMGLIKKATEQAIEKTRFPFLSTTLLARSKAHFCILSITDGKGMKETRQWKLKVRVDPFFIQKYNDKMEGEEKEEEKRIALNGYGYITITMGNDTRDETIRGILKAMMKDNVIAHGGIFKEERLTDGNRFFRLDEIDEGVECACSKYPEEKKEEEDVNGYDPNEFDPFLDSDDFPN